MEKTNFEVIVAEYSQKYCGLDCENMTAKIKNGISAKCLKFKRKLKLNTCDDGDEFHTAILRCDKCLKNFPIE